VKGTTLGYSTDLEWKKFNFLEVGEAEFFNLLCRLYVKQVAYKWTSIRSSIRTDANQLEELVVLG